MDGMHIVGIVVCNLLVSKRLRMVRSLAWHGPCYTYTVMEARKPELDLKATCGVGGRPGALHVSPDGSRLYVIDQAAPRATVVGTPASQVLASFALELPSGS